MRQKPLSFVGAVAVDGRIAEGHVADRKIETAVGETRVLETLMEDFYVLMRGLRDACRKSVHLNADDVALLAHLFGHRVEEAPAAARRLQDVARLEAHAGKPLADGFGDFRRRIEGVEDRAACRRVLLVRQDAAKRLIFLAPCFVSRIEDFGKAAETAVASEELRFFLARRASHLLDAAHHLDRREIALKYRTLSSRRGKIGLVINLREVDRLGIGSLFVFRRLQIDRFSIISACVSRAILRQIWSPLSPD